jgi:hypothetical protein
MASPSQTMTLPTTTASSSNPTPSISGFSTPNPSVPLSMGFPPNSLPTHHSSGVEQRAEEDVGLKKSKWYKIDYGRGMINDIRRRAPYYASDWLDAWDYRVVPATIYMYFAKYVSSLELTFLFQNHVR